ncbi:MAG: hypothetical protein KatS3mg103_0099 [Phycisphaerales bacterium]|nr:MAG: hypothetical protein KatS3mg103_0099 [Phycisphaerales bacterium]
MSGRRLALVAYYFPPIGGAGTQRAAKLCRYLGSHGWCPTVLSLSPGADARMRGSSSQHLDQRLADELPQGLPIVRIDQAEPLRWLDEAAEHLQGLVERRAVDALLVTMSPFWLCGLVDRFADRLPVVVDLRDPWALDGVPTYRHWFQWRADLKRMARTLSRAHQVVMNTPEARSAVLKAFPRLDPARVHAIPNGFDPADFEHARPAPRPPGVRFLLVHTGTFLTRQALPPRGPVGRLKAMLRYRPEPIRPIGRSVGPILEAIDRLRRESPGLMEGFRFMHVGTLDPATRTWIDRSPARDLVQAEGYLPHDASVSTLLGADALFLHLHGLPPGAPGQDRAGQDLRISGQRPADPGCPSRGGCPGPAGLQGAMRAGRPVRPGEHRRRVADAHRARAGRRGAAAVGRGPAGLRSAGDRPPIRLGARRVPDRPEGSWQPSEPVADGRRQPRLTGQRRCLVAGAAVSLLLGQIAGHTTEWANQTSVHPVGLTVLGVLSALIFVLPRRWSLLPLLVLACFVPAGQRIVIASLDFSFLRIMVIAYWIRILAFQDFKGLRPIALDYAVLAWVLVGSFVYILQWAELSAVTNRAGYIYESLGLYTTFRCLLRSWADVERAILDPGVGVLAGDGVLHPRADDRQEPVLGHGRCAGDHPGPRGSASCPGRLQPPDHGRLLLCDRAGAVLGPVHGPPEASAGSAWLHRRRDDRRHVRLEHPAAGGALRRCGDGLRLDPWASGPFPLRPGRHAGGAALCHGGAGVALDRQSKRRRRLDRLASVPSHRQDHRPLR